MKVKRNPPKNKIDKWAKGFEQNHLYSAGISRDFLSLRKKSRDFIQQVD